MSYQKVNLPNLGPMEAGIQLDTGAYVAMYYDVSRDPISQNLVFHVRARQVNDQGEPLSDSKGVPVLVEFRHSSPPSQIESMGQDAVAKDCMLLALGETTTIPFSDDMASCSIRNAINQASYTTNTDASSIL